MSLNEAGQVLLGTTAGVAVVFAALLSSSASVRAGQMWAAQDRFKATAMASFAGLSGATALAGMVLGVLWVALNSPVAS
jgi:hypothetical protein